MLVLFGCDMNRLKACTSSTMTNILLAKTSSKETMLRTRTALSPIKISEIRESDFRWTQQATHKHEVEASL